MTRTLLGALLALLVPIAALAQGKPAAFEVASIRPTGDQLPAGARVGFQSTGSQVRVTGMSLKDYLGIAYTLRLQQIEGPDWLGQQRWDVLATIPDGVAPAKVPEMLQTLLAERFQVKLHRETKELPVYALVRVEERREAHRVRARSQRARRPARYRECSGWRHRGRRELGPR